MFIFLGLVLVYMEKQQSTFFFFVNLDHDCSRQTWIIFTNAIIFIFCSVKLASIYLSISQILKPSTDVDLYTSYTFIRLKFKHN